MQDNSKLTLSFEARRKIVSDRKEVAAFCCVQPNMVEVLCVPRGAAVFVVIKASKRRPDSDKTTFFAIEREFPSQKQ